MANDPVQLSAVQNATAASNPSNLAAIGSTLYFRADGGSGAALWKSDGTAGGTQMVKDIAPANLTADSATGTLYFTADDGSNGVELWESDGTAGGTQMVKDINSTPGASSNPGNLTVDESAGPNQGTLYFTADDGSDGIELWESDGTPGGTQMVKDINSTPGASSNPANLTVDDSSGPNQGTLYFKANDGSHGFELWSYDPGGGGDPQLVDINPTGSSNPSNLTVDDSPGPNQGTLYFTANDGTDGFELWSYDPSSGAPQPQLVKGIDPDGSGSDPGNLTVDEAAGTLYFTAQSPSGIALWSYDLAGGSDPQIVQDIDPANLTADNVSGALFFAANDGTHGTELWEYDGTPGGAHMVKDINPNPGAGSNPLGLTVDDSGGPNQGTLYFTANDGSNGTELWSYDPAGGGGPHLVDINSMPGASSKPTGLIVAGNTLYFAANDGVTGTELWSYDPAGGAPGLVKDINQVPAGSPPVSDLTNVNGTLFFTASTSGAGDELWKSDGTVGGTQMVADIWPGSGSSSPSNLTAVGGTLFFSANDGTHGTELWESDGTTGGTQMVKDLRLPGGSNPINLSDVDGILYFSADDGTHGAEPWSYNPVGGGDPQPLGDINPSGSSFPSHFTGVGGKVVFIANDGGDGAELWESDGTPGGTQMVKDINPNPGAGSNPAWLPDGLGTLNGDLLFSADNGSDGTELWKTDATAAGTTEVADINPGSAGSFPIGFTNFNGAALFAADGGSGSELWTTDGTTAGTKPVADVIPSSRAISGGTLFLAAGEVLGPNPQLWTTDGTTAGTTQLKDINVAPSSAGPAGLGVSVNGALYFTADDGTHGYELWKSDGTPGGTQMVADLNPSGDSRPTNLVAIGNTLYFTANDGAHGTQLWSLDTGPDSSASGDAPAGGTVATNSTTSADDPVGTAVTTPVAGPVTIDEGTTGGGGPGDYSLLTQEVHITAPAATAADPLVLTFYLDASVVQGADASSIDVIRDGVAMGDCDADAGTSAKPDPCVAQRTTNPDGSVAFTVLTSHASTWNFGLKVGMALSPAAGTDEVGTSHAVTATLADAAGNPLAGVLARFTVSGSVSTQDSCTTDASGQCSITYQGPEFPGTDQITAYADRNDSGSQDPDEPAAAPVGESWVLPKATAGKVSGAGQIPSPSGHGRISFALEAKSGRHGVRGNCEVVDPRAHTNVDCLNATDLVVDGNEATIYGDAKVDHARTTYKLTVVDGGRHSPDSFRIVTSSGYLAAGALMEGGIRVRPAWPHTRRSLEARASRRLRRPGHR